MASEAGGPDHGPGGPGNYASLHDRLSHETGALWNDSIDATTGDQAQRVIALAMCAVHERLGEVVELLAQLVQDGRTPTVVRDLTDLADELDPKCLGCVNTPPGQTHHVECPRFGSDHVPVR